MKRTSWNAQYDWDKILVPRTEHMFIEGKHFPAGTMTSFRQALRQAALRRRIGYKTKRIGENGVKVWVLDHE